MLNEIKLPEISQQERTPVVETLLEIIQQLVDKVRYQEELIVQLKEEIAVLKKQNTRPRLRPSKMDKEAGEGDSEQDKSSTCRGKKKGKKRKQLMIHNAN